MLDKARIIDAIQEINTSAAKVWLEAFDASALRRYLDHLQITREPRGRASVWVRPGDSPAIVGRRPAV
jgi:hypothetical protein